MSHSIYQKPGTRGAYSRAGRDSNGQTTGRDESESADPSETARIQT